MWFKIIGPDGQTYVIQASDAARATQLARSQFAGMFGATDMGQWNQQAQPADESAELYARTMPNLVLKASPAGVDTSTGSTGGDTTDGDGADGGYGDPATTLSGLEGQELYYPAYLRAMKQSGRDIQGPGLWARTQRDQFQPAFASFLGQDILGSNTPDQTDEDRANAFTRYVQNNGRTGYANSAATSFKQIDESRPPVGGGIDTRDPSLVTHVNLYRNPLTGGNRAGDLAEQGYNLARAGSRMKRSAYWDKYLPTAGNLYSGWLADTSGEPTETSDWFDYLKQKGVA